MAAAAAAGAVGAAPVLADGGSVASSVDAMDGLPAGYTAMPRLWATVPAASRAHFIPLARRECVAFRAAHQRRDHAAMMAALSGFLGLIRRVMTRARGGVSYGKAALTALNRRLAVATASAEPFADAATPVVSPVLSAAASPVANGGGGDGSGAVLAPVLSGSVGFAGGMASSSLAAAAAASPSHAAAAASSGDSVASLPGTQPLSGVAGRRSYSAVLQGASAAAAGGASVSRSSSAATIILPSAAVEAAGSDAVCVGVCLSIGGDGCTAGAACC